MRSTIASLILALLSFACFGQEKPLLVFDLVNQTLDSIPIPAYDTTTVSEQTSFFVGEFNSTIITLSQTPPVTNTYPNSNFTYKRRASLDFDLTQYPIRTSVRLFTVNNDTAAGFCSGSLISQRHVLTAAHCVSGINTNTLTKDSIEVYPVFDNGSPNMQFDPSYVTKIYIVRDWRVQGEDLALLELEEPIGASTGWVSIGFNTDNTDLSDGIFYKFSYPAIPLPGIDTNEYNGDTLYYNYGIVDSLTNSSLRITNTSGVPGESGSSLIKITNEQEYTTYGVLSLALNLNHSRISRGQYYAIKNIITNDLTVAIPPVHKGEELVIYPNPVGDLLHIKNLNDNEDFRATLYDNLGRTTLNINGANSSIDVSHLPPGIYFLKVISETDMETKKIVKK